MVCVWVYAAGGTSIQVCTGTCSLTQSEYQQTETDRQTRQGTHTHSALAEGTHSSLESSQLMFSCETGFCLVSWCVWCGTSGCVGQSGTSIGVYRDMFSYTK